ncbi:ceramide kinase isoform X2 [Magnolia sinica]|uniref:ceramide kinase isoform X2 n=1 Tax=Magnolia sinica TaxID=86752 RepID=UPI002659B4FB|nr:ceramide kinase isoform X2 [Magnolia sinica]
MQLDQVGPSAAGSNLILDHVGQVVLTLNPSGLSWKLAKDMENEEDSSYCLAFASKTETEIKFSDVYSVEFINWGLIHEPILPNAGGFFLGRDSEMYRFVVHGYQKSKIRRNLWVLTAYIFGHKDLKMCQTWVEQINACINMEVGRPKSLLVFIHPLSGKGNGRRIWETVAPIFSRAKVRTKVIVTQRAGHAFDLMKSTTDRELNSYDGVIAGGDGFFNEILNGLLSSRHHAPYPPAPTEFMQSIGHGNHYPAQRRFNHSSSEGGSVHNPNDTANESPRQSEDRDPLLPSSEAILSESSNFRTEIGPCDTDQDSVFSIPHERFRLGIIPAGSTDAIVISTTGTRDPVTSALHIVLGKRRCLDIAQVVRWKATISSTDAPTVRYAASFAGYGFYGDVITESEKYRWMGPKRYDFAGTKVFMKHRSYEADVSFLEVKSAYPITKEDFPEIRTQRRRLLENPKKVVCSVNCPVCEETVRPASVLLNGVTTVSQVDGEDLKWLRSKGCFLSVGAAIISCRNERAPDGLVADAHLADGLMHLILIKDCPRTFYLWHLTQLTRKGSNPLNFEFVEHHKTTAFTFTSSSDESAWNLDGELLQARQLSAQVFRGLISLFAAGPEI